MILEDVLVVDAPLSAVLSRITGALEADSLNAALTAEVAESHETLIRAGIAGVTKAVHLRTLPPRVIDGVVVIAIRWDSVGAAGSVFPSLDGDLKLSRIDRAQTRLTFTGSYQPPFGRVGATLDRLLLHQVAEATVRNFLTHLAEIAAHAATAPTQPIAGAESSIEPYLGGLNTSW